MDNGKAVNNESYIIMGITSVVPNDISIDFIGLVHTIPSRSPSHLQIRSLSCLPRLFRLPCLPHFPLLF